MPAKAARSALCALLFFAASAAGCGGKTSQGDICRENSDCESNDCGDCICPDSMAPVCPRPGDGGQLEFEETCRCQ
jgi:hypothetical protein